MRFSRSCNLRNDLFHLSFCDTYDDPSLEISPLSFPEHGVKSHTNIMTHVRGCVVLPHQHLWCDCASPLLFLFYLLTVLHAQSLSCIQLFVTPPTEGSQAPLPMEFSRLECWSGVPFLSSRDLLNLGIQLTFLVSPALTGRFLTSMPPWKPTSSEAYMKSPVDGC